MDPDAGNLNWHSHHWWPEYKEEPTHLGYGEGLFWLYAHRAGMLAAKAMNSTELQAVTHGIHTTKQESTEDSWYEYQTRGFPKEGEAFVRYTFLPVLPALTFAPGDMGYAANNQSAAGPNQTIVLPCPLALAACFDDGCVKFAAEAMSDVSMIKGVNTVMGPSLNVIRSPYSGRAWESIGGEDPYLAGRLGGDYTREVRAHSMICVFKYFAFHDHEDHIFDQNAVVDDHSAHELYFLPFQMAIEMGMSAVFCSPKKVNGTHACENPELLKRWLKTEMGFKGMVIAQPGAWTNSTKAFQAGVDLILPAPGQELPEDVADDDLRTAAENVLATVYWTLGKASMRMAYPLKWEGGIEDWCIPPANCSERRAFKAVHNKNYQPLKMLHEMTVLLKNDGNLLPLRWESESHTTKVAVRGAFVNMSANHRETGDYYAGGGDAYNVQGDVKTFYEVIEQKCNYPRHCDSHACQDMNCTIVKNLLAADVCIVATGAVAAEGSDRKNLLVDDNDLIFAVAAKCKKTVVVMALPGPVVTPWRHKVDAIIANFYYGDITAPHYGSILFSKDFSPSGKLPVSFPLSEDDVPHDTSLDNNYTEHMNVGYRTNKEAAFPFGFGLSYADWKYDNITAWKGGGPKCTRDLKYEGCGCATIQVNVTSLSYTRAKQVIQVYIEFGGSDEPSMVLRGFKKTGILSAGELPPVPVESGERPGPNLMYPSHELVWIHLQQRDVSLYHPETGWWPQKRFKVHVGTSSRDILRTMEVESACVPWPEYLHFH